LKAKVSEMRKKQDINIACKRDLDRQVCEMKDFENLIKNQVSTEQNIVITVSHTRPMNLPLENVHLK
jgi:hypothetical protein